MNFSKALEHLKESRRVVREGWNGKGMWLRIEWGGDAASLMTHPYIYIEYPFGHRAYPNGCRVPWLASQTDIMADDWQVIMHEFNELPAATPGKSLE